MTDWKEYSVMTTTFINTAECARIRLQGLQGVAAEVLNNDLCGAKNVTGMLRWLSKGEQLEAQSGQDMHQLIYLMEGEGVITLEKKEYEVAKGAGVYLGPAEAASIRHAGTGTLKLFHLLVPKARR
jgi:quercetin dioxygenase-like cupin family protein